MALNLGAIFYQLGVDTSGLNKASTNVKSFQGSTTKSFDQINQAGLKLKQTLGALISVEALRRGLTMADNYALLENRVTAVVGSTEKASVIFSKLERISAKTGASLSVTAGGFQKLAFAKETVRGTDEDMVKLTKAFTELGLISGTSSEALNSAMLQFSQGLISGTFQAQEFQSVVEAVPAIAEQMAKGMGLTNAELLKMKKDGKLLSEDVFDALLKQTDEIAAAAEGLPMRMDRGFSRLTLGITQALSGIDKAQGFTERLGESFFEAGEKLEKVPIYANALFDTFKDLVKEGNKFEDIARAVFIVQGAMLGVAAATKVVTLAFGLLSKINPFIVLATGIVFILDHFELLDKGILGAIALFKALGKAGFEVLSNLAGVILNVSDMFQGLLLWDIPRMKDNYSKIEDAFKLTALNTVDIAKNAKDEVDQAFLSSDKGEGLLSGIKNLLGPDIANLDLVKSFQDNLIEGEKTFLEKMAKLNDDADKDKTLKTKLTYTERLGIDKWYNDTKAKFQNDANQIETETARKGFREQISAAGEHSKQFAALAKSLAIFDLAVKTPQAIGDAFTFGNAIGGPIVGAAFGAVAGAAMGVQIAAVASQNFTPRAVGGDVFPNQMYQVNENGPELFNFGGKEILSTGSARGSITPNGAFGNSGSSSGSNVTVNVYPIEGQTANVQETQDGSGGIQIDVIMEQVDLQLADGIQRGVSNTSQALQSVFGLNRAVGAFA